MDRLCTGKVYRVMGVFQTGGNHLAIMGKCVMHPSAYDATGPNQQHPQTWRAHGLLSLDDTCCALPGGVSNTRPATAQSPCATS